MLGSVSWETVVILETVLGNGCHPRNASSHRNSLLRDDCCIDCLRCTRLVSLQEYRLCLSARSPLVQVKGAYIAAHCITCLARVGFPFSGGDAYHLISTRLETINPVYERKQFRYGSLAAGKPRSRAHLPWFGCDSGTRAHLRFGCDSGCGLDVTLVQNH